MGGSSRPPVTACWRNLPASSTRCAARSRCSRRCPERNTGVAADRRIELRIGINLGDVIVEGDDLYGDGVNIAARIEALADAGGVLVSNTVYDHVRDRLPFLFEDLGEHQVKNIVRPVRVFRVRPEGPLPNPTLPGLDPGTTGEGSARSARVGAAEPPALPLPDKPSIAVLPFANISGDPEQDYFADGMVEEIITALSRFRALFVIARNSTFTYKGKAVDVRQVARDLGVRYVVEGSIRRAGERLRVTAQLIDASTNNHLWAERYDRMVDDVFAVQEDVTRNIVAAVAPSVELAEVAQARRAGSGVVASQLTWRAQGLFYEAFQQGRPSVMLDAIAMAQQAIAADPMSLGAYGVLGWIYWCCHLWRWGPEPEKALDASWAAVEHMQGIDALDDRTLTIQGLVRAWRGEQERAIADLRRAQEANPNSAHTLMWLAFAEATVGLGPDAKEHALLALRLSPRDFWFIGTAQLALAMASYSGREYTEAVRWAETAIQSFPKAPIRRAIMIACCARAGNVEKATLERAVLDGFAPDFIPSMFRGENRVFTRPEDMEHLLEGLRLAAAETA
jgi:adenylate cyclase